MILLQYYEKLPAHQIDDLQMNDIQFMFCDQVIVFDHFKQQIKVIANIHVPPIRNGCGYRESLSSNL